MIYGHGGDVYSIAFELGIRPEEVLDFSSNCSPLPYPEGLEDYLCGNLEQMHLLPEVDSVTIRRLLADRYRLEPDNFLIGSGTTQWIYSLPRILKPKSAFVAYPTYADYEDACKAEKVPVFSLGTFPSGDRHQRELLLESIASLENGQAENALVFVCNPNNPTGLFIPPEKLIDAIRSKPSSVTWIIDESYAPFIEEEKFSSLLGCTLPDNVVLLRSFSKIYGIPGLRVGCLVSRAKALKDLTGLMWPWSVNRMAQLAVEFFLGMPGFEKKVRTYCQKEKDYIVGELMGLEGLRYMEGSCHFAMFELMKQKASDITSALKKQGILIRDCHNFKGLEGEFVRISPRLHEDNQKLVKEMRIMFQR